MLHLFICRLRFYSSAILIITTKLSLTILKIITGTWKTSIAHSLIDWTGTGTQVRVQGPEPVPGGYGPGTYYVLAIPAQHYGYIGR